MRNILLFPDGSEQSFMYPMNREIEEGEELQITLHDESVHLMQIEKIEVKDKNIYYYLSYR